MSSQEDGYGRTFAANERMARRGPSHQNSYKNHVHIPHQLARPTKAASDSQGTSHSLLRTPLFGSAVPRRQRTDSVKRPSTSWHDAARRLRQPQAAAGTQSSGRGFSRPIHQSVDTQVDTEQEHEVAEALFDLANMFARPAPSESQRKPAQFSQHPAARSNGAYGKIHRSRGESGQFKDNSSPKRQLTLPDRKIHSRDWNVKSESAARPSAQQLEAGLSDTSPGGNVSTPRAVKAAQHIAAPGTSSLGAGTAPPVSLGTGAFHPSVPPSMPAHFRNNGQAQPATQSEGHSGQWEPAGQSAGHASHARGPPESAFAGAFSKPSEGTSAPRPKSLRRSANHVYIAHMIVEWQHQMNRLNRQQRPYQQPTANPPYSASLHHPSEPASQRSQSGSLVLPSPRQSPPPINIKQELPASLPPQQSLPPSSAMPPQATSAFQFPPPFNLGAGMRPPTSQHLSGPRDSSGNIIPPAQYYKNMLGPQKFEALQPRLPLLQPGATWPMGPPGGPSPFASGPAMLSPQQAAAFAAQMSMFAAAPHTLPGLPGFPPGPLQGQLGSSQGLQTSLFPTGIRWPDGKEGATIQELPVSSSASPAVSEAKHVPSKPIKHEGGKAESGGGGVSNIPADALNRLIAMGGPAGFLDSHNLAQFGVPEHVLQAISKPNMHHTQNSQHQEGRSLR